MEKYLKVTTAGELIVVEIEGEQLLDGFYQALDCRSIKTVPAILGNGLVLIVDEEGGLNDGKSYNLFIEPFCPGFFYGIEGDVLIARFGVRDGNSDIVGLSDVDIQNISGLIACLFGNRITHIGENT